MVWDFAILRSRAFNVLHLTREFMSLWRSIKSFSVKNLLYILTSSANINDFEYWINAVMSFMNRINKRGPRWEPWGILDGIPKAEEI